MNDGFYDQRSLHNVRGIRSFEVLFCVLSIGAGAFSVAPATYVGMTFVLVDSGETYHVLSEVGRFYHFSIASACPLPRYAIASQLWTFFQRPSSRF
jgi:hypothetical protein